MFNWIKLVERNMRRNLRRTILTILTIALATFIYTVLVSVPASMDRVVKDASGTLRLIMVNKTAPWEDLRHATATKSTRCRASPRASVSQDGSRPGAT